MYQAPIESLSDSDLSLWRKAIADAKKTRDAWADHYGWQANIDRYRPKDAKAAEGQVNIGADFADVERKIAALFYTHPKISLLCDEPGQPLAPPQAGPDGQPIPGPTLGALSLIHQELLNELLSDSQIGIKHTIRQAILDVLLPAGVGPVRVGYTATTQPVTVPTGEDPLTGAPITQEAPIPIHEEFWVARRSPLALLLPPEFRDTDIRRAAWVGEEFTMPVSQLRAEYGIPDDVDIPTGHERPYFGKDDAPKDSDPPVTGQYLEYRAMLYGKNPHPKAIWCLVLIDGLDTPLKHGPSPHQTFGPDGRLTPDSLTDYSLLPLWIRDLPDSAWVPSDSTITGPLTKEINKFRTQMVTRRENTRQVILFDAEQIDPTALDKMKAGEIGAFVPVKPGSLTQGVNAIMAQVGAPTESRDNYTAQDYMQSDRERILGISANTAGADTGGDTTATEAQIVNRNSEARFNQEQARVLAFYMAVVRALDCLVLRYGSLNFVTPLIGPRKAQIWAQFKNALAGGYRYEVNVDSGRYMDAEAQRRQLLQFYQMTRQDPLINPKPLIERVLTAWGIDPAEGIAPPAPKEPTPPPVGISFKGDDFNPLNPQFEIAVAMAKQGGWQIDDAVIANAKAAAQAQQANALFAQVIGGPSSDNGPAPNTAHGGPATQQLPLSKRQMEESGKPNNAPGASV